MVKLTFPLDPDNDPWRGHLHAIGAITIAWNALEDWVAEILHKLTRFDQDSAQYFLGMIGNVTISGLITRLAKSTDGRPELADAVEHLLKGFDICRENRNIVLHSRVFDNALTGSTWLSKRVSTGGHNNFPGDLPSLQRIATEIDLFANYAVDVYVFVVSHPDAPKSDHLRYIIMAAPPATLPSKPDLPNRLLPHPPASAQKNEPRQPRPSRAIRKAQRRKLWKKPKEPE